MKQKHSTIISSKHKLFDLHIKETLDYIDLIKLFVKKTFVASYKQTVLGPAWALVNPILHTVFFTIIFGSLARLTTADVAGTFEVPSFLFYMTGTIMFSYFSTVVNGTANTFLANRGTMGKVYYPRIVSPISTAFSGLISFGIQFSLLLVFYLFFIIKGGTSISPGPMLLLIPLLILQLMILSVGIGIIISSVTTKYRDLMMLLSFIISMWQYASPVAYGLNLVSTNAPNVMWLYMLNPITPIITTFRYALFGFGYFNLAYYLISWGITLIVFFIGLVSFSKIERTFMDTI